MDKRPVGCRRTAGTNGCWYVDRSTNGNARALSRIHRRRSGYPPAAATYFMVAYAAGLARACPLRDTPALASAAAALKACKPGGPSLEFPLPMRSISVLKAR